MSSPEPEKKPKKSSATPVVLIIGAVLLVIVLCAGVPVAGALYFLMARGKAVNNAPPMPMQRDVDMAEPALQPPLKPGVPDDEKRLPPDPDEPREKQ